MKGKTSFNAILMLCFLQAFECGKKAGCCDKGRMSKRSSGLVTFSAIMDSKVPGLSNAPEDGLTRVWGTIDRDVKTDEDIFQKGREFLSYVKERYNVDMSILTDEELKMGRNVVFGNLTFMGYVLNADLRVVTETTPIQRVTHYKNAKFRSVGYVIVATEDTILEGGKWSGLMTKNSAIFAETGIIDSKESEVDEEPHILSVRTLGVHPAKFYQGKYVNVNTLEAEVWSNKYGHGLQYGIDMHPVFVQTFVNVFFKDDE
ncbi:unnamed protein product [Owenia fusiformis]|uniref:Uncharacterized protein n=1 Tax=Owenia fusiformis TaxID=6347 RepID=A0A8S4NP22_OWEFU|nr:unnamed protein product [Owenia fusiformis]